MNLRSALGRAVAADPGKPMLRGYSHAVMAPVALLATAALVALSDSNAKRVTLAIYGTSLVVLLAFSAIYHIGSWMPKVSEILRRVDHANIYLLIAGTYTPIAAVALRGWSRVAILGAVWFLALVGIGLVVPGVKMIRPLESLLYLLTGWVALAAVPAIGSALGVGALLLLLAGGATYSAGAVIYAFRRPRLWHRVFGYHELFHALVIAASVIFFIFMAVFIVPYRSS